MRTRTRFHKPAKKLDKVQKPEPKKRSRKWLDTSNNVRVTRGMTTNASRHAVLETAELMECILLHLPVRSIIACQRVCKSFRTLIAKSAYLQSALTFQRDKHQPAQTWKWEHDLDSRPSYGGFRVLRPGEPEHDPEGQPITRVRPARLCPLLRLPPHILQFDELRENCAARFCGYQCEYVLLNFSWQGPPQTPASWEQMFVSDPPATSALVCYIEVQGYDRDAYDETLSPKLAASSAGPWLLRASGLGPFCGASKPLRCSMGAKTATATSTF